MNQKYFDAIKLAIASSPIVFIVETYFFDDWEFLKYLIVAMLIDWMWGFALAWKTATISQEGFRKFGKKLAEYATLLILGHVMLRARSGGDPMTIFSYLTTTMHGYLLVREAISILEKIARVSPNLVPKWLLDKLKVYRDTGNVDNPENHEKNQSEGY